MSATRHPSFHGWQQFWFSPRTPTWISALRVAIGLLTTLQFIHYYFIAMNWFGATGWFNPDVGRYLIGDGVDDTGSIYRWSLLFAFPNWNSIVAGIGTLAGIAMMAGMGSRASPLLAWLALAMFHHRAPFLVSVHEPLLSAMLAYLVVDPGKLDWSIRPGFQSGPARLSSNIALQLIRCHFGIWVAFSLASMLASPLWWNGEAAWLLMQSGQGWLTLQDGWQFVGQAFTHVVIAAQVAILVTLLLGNLRWLGRWFLYVFLACILFLLGDWMYAAILMTAGLSVWPIELPKRGNKP
jgi:hypothetical protein